MRIVTVVALALTVALAMFARWCEGAALHGQPLPDDDEEFRPRRLYREYGIIRGRSARADDAFDDYGHLRFGRSDE